MILDVHFAFLIASLSVLFGMTYSLGKFLDYKMEQLRASRQTSGITNAESEMLSS